jgi:hypothetical protein
MESSYNIFLDDFRHPYDAFNIWKDTDFLKLKWVIVRSHDEFAKTITDRHSNGEWPAIIAFDHDLSDEHYDMDFSDMNYLKTTIPTGYHSAEWLIDFCVQNNLDLPGFKVHSQSTSGRKNITDVLEKFSASKK